MNSKFFSYSSKSISATQRKKILLSTHILNNKYFQQFKNLYVSSVLDRYLENLSLGRRKSCEGKK